MDRTSPNIFQNDAGKANTTLGGVKKPKVCRYNNISSDLIVKQFVPKAPPKSSQPIPPSAPPR